MKLRCRRNYLVFAISSVQPFANPQLRSPILGDVLVTAQDAEGKVYLQAGDTECMAQCAVEAKILESGAMAVPANLLGGILRGAHSEWLDMEAADGVLEIRSDEKTYHLAAAPSESFPKWGRARG